VFVIVIIVVSLMLFAIDCYLFVVAAVVDADIVIIGVIGIIAINSEVSKIKPMQ